MLIFVRYVLPGIVTIAGLMVMAIGGDDSSLEGGAAIVGAGLSIALLNWLWRVGVTGDKERDEEEFARMYFDEHGRWPEDPPELPADDSAESPTTT